MRSSHLLLLCLITLVIASTSTSAAPPKPGALTPAIIADFQKAMEKDARGDVLINAATQNSLSALALNHELAKQQDHNFTKKLSTGPATNQKGSGRCWLFAGFNILRPHVMKKHNLKDFEFSENHLFFWDKLEKANLFLEGILETRSRPLDDRLVVHLLKMPFPDGGQWHMVVDLLNKYGAVPKDIMPETKHTSGTGEINKLISRLLRKNAAQLRAMHKQGRPMKALRECKVGMMATIYRLLCYHFGKPPVSFKWRFMDKKDKLSPWKEYTPKSFYKAFVAMDLGDYHCLYSSPAHGIGKMYQIRFCRSIFDGQNMTFANLPIQSLKAFAQTQLLAGEPVWFGCDVGKEYHRDSGVLRLGIYDYEGLLGADFAMTKKERILYRESIPTHAMVFQGVDMQFGKPVKWRVENSWGKDRALGGYLTMYDDWFDVYMYSVIIHKKHLPQDVIQLQKQKPQVLPPWDPMFQLVRWQ